MTTPKLTKADLSQFTGSQEFFVYPLGRLILTEGVRHLAEAAGAYWLIDAIASYQADPRIAGNRMLRDIQFWRLAVVGGRGVLTCREDSGREPVISQQIEFTDFPLDEVEIWLEWGGIPTPDGRLAGFVAMLPSER